MEKPRTTSEKIKNLMSFVLQIMLMIALVYHFRYNENVTNKDIVQLLAMITLCIFIKFDELSKKIDDLNKK